MYYSFYVYAKIVYTVSFDFLQNTKFLFSTEQLISRKCVQ